MATVSSFVRKRREARVRKLNSIIARSTILIHGTDADIWPHDVALAEQARKAASFERVDLLHKLSKGH